MSESYIKAEIVRPKWTPTEWSTKILGAFLGLAIQTLVVFWLFASWLPHFGFTYWQLVLPVFAFRLLNSAPLIGRQLK